MDGMEEMETDFRWRGPPQTNDYHMALRTSPIFIQIQKWIWNIAAENVLNILKMETAKRYNVSLKKDQETSTSVRLERSKMKKNTKKQQISENVLCNKF